MKNGKFNRKFRRGVAASLGAICCSSIISEAKVDIDLQNIMNDFKLSGTDPDGFEDIIKQKTDNLLKLGTIEIDDSFGLLDNKSKFVVISALEKLSEIPLVKKALTHNGQKCKLMGEKSRRPFGDVAAGNYKDNELKFASDFYEWNSSSLKISESNLNPQEHMQYINEGKYFGYGEKDSINSHVSSRMIYGMNLDKENKKLLYCLNTVVHEIGHFVDKFSMEKLAYSSDGYDRALKLVSLIGEPDISFGRGDSPDYKVQLQKAIDSYTKWERRRDPTWVNSHLKRWIAKKDPYISNIAIYGGTLGDEYLAELFVHLCGFNLPISQHAKRYADILKVIHGEDCLGDTVKYQ